MELFDFSDYKEVIKWQIEKNKSVKGYQTLLSKAAGCQRAFLSQVLHSHIHLTPDHSAGLCAFWRFNDYETDYFLELVSIARASSPSLQKAIKRRIESIKKSRSNLAERFNTDNPLSENAKSIYYSSWHFAAVHVILSIPEYNDIKKISKRLRLPINTIEQTIKILQDLKIIKKNAKGWSVSFNDLYLPSTSHFTNVNHINWRQRAIENIQKQDPDALHYSVISALSINDIELFRKNILKCIEDSRKIVAPSPEEEMICFTCDFFKI